MKFNIKSLLIFLLGILIITLGVWLTPKLPVNPTYHLMVVITEEKDISLMKAKLTIKGLKVNL